MLAWLAYSKLNALRRSTTTDTDSDSSNVPVSVPILKAVHPPHAYAAGTQIRLGPMARGAPENRPSPVYALVGTSIVWSRAKSRNTNVLPSGLSGEEGGQIVQRLTLLQRTGETKQRAGLSHLMVFTRG